MKKSTFCTEHFVMGCKLCGADAPPDIVATAGASNVIPFTTPIPTETVGLPAGGDYINLSAATIPQPPKIETRSDPQNPR